MDQTGILVLLVLVVYFLPTILAVIRRGRWGAVLAVNLLTGWTVAGWVVAFIMAFVLESHPGAEDRPVAVYPVLAEAAPGPEAGAAVADAADERLNAADPTSEMSNAAYTRRFLTECLDRDLLSMRTYLGLLGELETWEAVTAAAATPAQTAASSAVAEPQPAPPVIQPTFQAPPLSSQASEYQQVWGSPAPTFTSEGVLAVPSEPVPLAFAPSPTEPPRPAPWSAWREQLWSARQVVRSDFAVHGLAYLGVLLTFAGTLGFVLFAYTTVSDPWLRALGPLVIPLFLGVASWMLYRRGSVLVSVSLELLGAALVPVLLSAAISTGWQGNLQIALRTAMAVALMVVYAGAVIRRPASPLKYLVAPMFWTAVWTATLVFRDNHYSAAQVAVTASAVAATVSAMGLWTHHRFAEPTRFAAIAGIAVTYTLSILFAITEGGPPLPILVTGMATLVTVEVLAFDSRRQIPLSLLQSLVLAVSLAAIVQPWGLPAVGALAALGYMAILEWQEFRRPSPYALFIPLAGLLAGLVISIADGWAAVVAGTTVSLWAHGRRIRPWSSTRLLPRFETTTAFEVGAGLVPLALASGLWRTLPQGRALLVMAAILFGSTLAVRTWRRRDLFYFWWLPIASAAVAIATASARGTVFDGELAMAVILAGAALALALRWPVARLWSSVATGAWASVLVFDAFGVDNTIRPILWSIAAVGAVALASIRISPASGHLALAGHVGSAVALGLSAPGGARVVTLGAWTAGWLGTVIAHELRRSPLVPLLQWAGSWIRIPRQVGPAIPPLVLVISAPFLIAKAAEFFGIASHHRSWIGVAQGLAALAYSVAARFLSRRRPLAPVLATASVLLSAIGIAVAAPDLDASILAVAGSLAAVAVMGGALRRPIMSWFAWGLVIVLCLLIAHRAGVPIGSLRLVLIGVGGAFLVGGLLWDEVRAGIRYPGDGLRVGWLTQPVSLGALALPTGLAFSLTDRPSAYSWWMIAAAVLYLIVALQLRTGAVSGVAWALAAFGVATLAPWQPLDHPEWLVPFAGALVAASFALSAILPGSSDPWRRWDLPPLVLAHLVAGLAIARTAQVDSVAVTWSALGGLSLILAAWRRHPAWAAGGMLLVLVGARAAGPGWFALALTATSAGTVVAASRTVGAVRPSLQTLSVLTAASAWLEALIWADRATDWELAATALAAGAGAAALGLLVRFVHLRHDWIWSWGVLISSALVITAILAPAQLLGSRTSALAAAAGIFLYALAAISLEKPLGWLWLRWLSAAALGSAWLEILAGAPWTVEQQVAFTAIGAGAVAILIAALVGRVVVQKDSTLPFAVLATIAIVSSSGVATALLLNRRAAIGVAAGLVLYSVACARAVRSFGWPWLAWLSAYTLAWAGGELLIGSEWTVGQATAASAIVAGVVAIGLALLLRFRRLPANWLKQWASLTCATLTLAAGVSVHLEANLESDHRLAAIGVALGTALFALATASVARLLWWPALTWVSVIATGGAWLQLVMAAGWSIDQGVGATGIAAGALALAAGAAAHLARLKREWIWSAGALASVGLCGAVVTGLTVGNHRDPYALGVATGLALYAAGAALAARPLGWAWLREFAGVAAVGAFATALYDRQPPVELSVSALVAAGLLGLLLSLAVWVSRPRSAWLRPLGLFASLVSAGALALALSAWPNRGPLIAALLVVGAEAAAVGLTLRRPAPLYASPLLVCIAWLLFATQALNGNPNWLTVPIGLAVLIIVELVRWDRRMGSRLASEIWVGNVLIALDYAGMAFIVGAPLVETIFVTVWYGVLGLIFGVGLVGWAALTRVRRRTEFGSGVVLLSLFLMITVPVVRIIPEIHGITLWASVAAIGMLLLLVATTIEQSRAYMRAGIRRLDDLMAGWE